MINDENAEADVLSSGGINMVHLNVGSMLGAGKLEMLRKQIETGVVDVFCASETWLNEGVPDGLVLFNGFKLARLDRAWADDANKGKPNLIFNEFRYSFLNHSSKDLEMQWISLEIQSMKRVVVINVYRPPQGDYKKACRLNNDALVSADLKDNVDIFLLGDFNIDLKNKTSAATKELLTTTSIWGLPAQIKGITRPNTGATNDEIGRGSCIDNIFTNSDHVQEAKILNWNFSDHLAIYVKRKRARVHHSKVDFHGRSHKNYVKEDLKFELLQKNWDLFFASRDVKWCWDFIDTAVKNYLDRVCPKKRFKVNEIREPWVTDEILEMIKDKDSSVRVAKRSGRREDLIRAKAERNRVGRLIDQAKAYFLKDQQEQLIDDPKIFWRVVKTIVPGKKARATKISLVNKDAGLVDKTVNSAETANYINKFFCNIGPKLVLQHNEPWVFHGQQIDEECPSLITNFEQVRRLCREINTMKSSGLPDCSSRVYKDAFMVIIPQLVYLFNLSFSVGTVPDAWKKATIIPLYKGGDKTEVGNYRPVSLLPLPGKLIEKIAHVAMSNFFNRNGILTDKQGGFRKGFSTAASIADLTNTLFNNINKGLTSLAAFIDLKKAFDTVNHVILLKKLGSCQVKNRYPVGYLKAQC